MLAEYKAIPEVISRVAHLAMREGVVINTTQAAVVVVTVVSVGMVVKSIVVFKLLQFFRIQVV